MHVTGWLFDLYPQGDEMIVWLKQANGETIRLKDNWQHSIYVASNSKADLQSIVTNADITQLVKSHEFVSKQEKITDSKKSSVLKLTLADSTKGAFLARKIERLGKFGQYRLYNADLKPAQCYLYEHDHFTLAYCDVETSKDRLIWHIKDDVWHTDYDLPDLQSMHLEVTINKAGKLPKFTDKIASIIIRLGNETIELDGKPEVDLLASLESEITKIDPDFIITQDGDSFLYSYLIARAELSKTYISLNRENMPIVKPAKDGTSYFSYGRIHFKPSSVYLYGRVNLDMHNSFIWHEAGLAGLYEIARICRMPLHIAARASIGKCMSSLQFYHATKQDLLVPFKPVLAEHFKTYKELLIADRGGFVFEPESGVHERVAEFDFASLYANIMLKRNISAETVRCECCPDSYERVPELDYNICVKRKGIVPISLKILVEKRAKYKLLKKAATDPKQRAIYDARQGSLKWVLVTSFGYLGFNNAKFGRIDAHIAVCAFDRYVLLQATRIAERAGFTVLHGIVDSLWLKKPNATQQDYLQLKQAIEQETGFEISFEGLYKWVVFVHSKESKELPVANRYFGVFENGEIKDRGIETRRHDTPPLFNKFQREVLQIMAKGNNVREVKALMPQVFATFQKYKQMLRERKVLLADLVFTKQLSKESNACTVNTAETNALYQLTDEGESLHAGEVLQYIITDYGRRNSRKRTVPVELINEKTTYDANKYIEILAGVCNSVIEPFGFQVNNAVNDSMRLT